MIQSDINEIGDRYISVLALSDYDEAFELIFDRRKDEFIEALEVYKKNGRIYQNPIELAQVNPDFISHATLKIHKHVNSASNKNKSAEGSNS